MVVAVVATGAATLDVTPAFPGWDRKVAAQTNTFTSAGRRAGANFAQGLQTGMSAAKNVVSSVVAPVAAGLIGLAGAGATVGVQTAAGMEQARISFTTMLKDGKKADAFLRDLSKFAAATPFEFPELQDAASSLVSAGVSANKVIPIMRTLGDVTAGMGTGSDGIQRATIAIQQMQAAQRISGEDLNQLRDAGIPVYDLLAKATGRSKAEVLKLAQAGKLGKKELDLMMKALESGKGLERFNGLMEKQSASLTGMWSSFQDAMNMGLAQAMQPLMPVLKQALGQASEFVQQQTPRLVGWTTALAREVPRVSALIGTTVPQVAKRISGLWASVTAGSGVLIATIPRVRAEIASLWERVQGIDGAALRDAGGQLLGLVSQSSQLLPALTNTVSALATGLGWFGDHMDLVNKALPFLLAGVMAYKAAQAANAVVGRESLIGFGLQLASTVALTVANRQLAASQQQVTAASGAALASENASMLSRIRGTAATVAKTVAERAAAVASRALAAGQWLVNAALTANPIGLVVVALAAMTAAVVLLYQRSETFRNIVSGALDAVASAGNTMWHGVLKPAFAAIVSTFLNLASSILDGAASAFSWVPGIGDKLKGAKDEFNKFKDSVNASLNGIDDKTVDVKVKFSGGAAGYQSSPFKPLASGGLVPRYADGGMINGPWRGPTADNVLGVDSRGIPFVRVNPREWIMRVNATAKLRSKYPGLLEYMNQHGDLPGHGLAGGGLALRTSVPPPESVQDLARSGLKGFAQSKASALYKALGDVLGNGKVMGWKAQWAWLQRAVPGVQLMSGFRPGAITATGKRSYHSMGRAVDVSPSMAVFNAIVRNFGRTAKEIIFSPAGIRQIHNGVRHVYTGITRAMHWDHVHWAMARGGLVPSRQRSRLPSYGVEPKHAAKVYDAGGFLPPGGVAVNFGHRPEAVLSPAQTDALLALVNGRRVDAPLVEHNGDIYTYDNEDMARREARAVQDAIDARNLRG